MNIPTITWGDGLVLTDPVLVSKIGSITAHQTTFLDFADPFVWGADQDFDGAGLQAVRHINGNWLVDPRLFGSGNDADAIQRAVDWIAATSEGRGTVLIPPLTAAWSIDQTITLADGIWILAHPAAAFSLDFSGYMFTLPSNTDGVRVENVRLDGNQRASGGLVDASAGNTSNVEIFNCEMGLQSAPTTTYVDGRLFQGAANAHDNVHLKDCKVFGGGALAVFQGSTSDNVLIEQCWLETAGGNASELVGLNVSNTNDLQIRDCYFWCHDGTNPLDRAIFLVGCNRAKVSDCRTYGGRLSAVRIRQSDLVEFSKNYCVNGGTGNVVGDRFIVWFDECDDCSIHANFITGVDSLSATIPINCEYALAESDAILVGSVTNNRNVIYDNFFAAHNNAGSLSGAGDFRVDSIFAIRITASAHHWGNRIFEGQRGFGSVTAGSPTANVSAPGVTASFLLPTFITSVAVTSVGTANQALKIHSVSADNITVRRHDGANLVAETFSWIIDI